MARYDVSVIDELNVRLPWEQQKGESARHYAAFCAFRDMHPLDRGVVAAFRETNPDEPRSRASVWNNWSREHDWVHRAECYDKYNDKLVQRVWQERRRVEREKEWSAATQLLEKATQMLEFPLAAVRHETSADGMTQITIVEPAGWKMADAAKLVETASKLARLSAGMATEILELSEDEIDRRIEGELERLKREALGVDAPAVEIPARAASVADEIEGVYEEVKTVADILGESDDNDKSTLAQEVLGKGEDNSRQS